MKKHPLFSDQVLILFIIGMSLFFLLFVFHLRVPIFGRIAWQRIDEFWPGAILLLSGAFLGDFLLTRFRDYRLLRAGLGSGLIGIIALAFTLEFISLNSVWRLRNPWLLILLLIGGGLLGETLLRRN